MSAKTPTTTPPVEPVGEKPPMIHFMCAARVIFTGTEEGSTRQRDMNVMTVLADTVITKDVLAGVQQAAMQRLGKENGVPPNMVKDVVILSMFPLGFMTEEQFAGTGEPTKH